MLRVGIIGARGYTGEELIDILSRHSGVKITYLTARLEHPVDIREIFPRFQDKIDILCENFEPSRATQLCDVLFLCLMHTASMDAAPLLLKENKLVIDLSADYRLSDYKVYEAWYKVAHKDKVNLKRAVYGLPEINRAKIKKANFIANPGCYASAAILSLAPLLKNKSFKIDNIIIDAKSGYSGAGRKAPEDPFWQELKDSFRPYKVDAHQHMPEISQELSKLAGRKTIVTFAPHILPIERGILETIYVKISNRPQVTSNTVLGIYKKFYKDEPFVRIRNEGEFPSLRDVQHTNFCDIGIKLSQDKKTIIIISAIDNLFKGASGQAVQNMNLMCGFKETEGLL
jgi:N-acetyl-gamma-glutamyl-phosphate reductase